MFSSFKLSALFNQNCWYNLYFYCKVTQIKDGLIMIYTKNWAYLCEGRKTCGTFEEIKDRIEFNVFNLFTGKSIYIAPESDFLLMKITITSPND